MCEWESRLAAWLDRELAQDEDIELELHVSRCAQCRSRAEAYERTSRAFDAYCDAVTLAFARQKASSSKWAAVAAAVAAAAVWAFLTAHPRAPITKPAPVPHVTAPRRSALAREVPPLEPPRSSPGEPSFINRGSLSRVQSQNAATPARIQRGRFLPPEPAVEIDIPADALLPPGAAPAGTTFLVDFSVAPDGSAQAIRLTPQLTGLDRRAAQP